MIINYLRINNFRQYKGEQEIQFSTDKQKNVTVVLGKNTSGKTTLLQAIHWCLYGETIYKTSLLNQDISQSMSIDEVARVTVVMGLIHDGTSYKITRHQQFKKTPAYGMQSIGEGRRIEYLDNDGQTKDVPSIHISDSIDKILPKDLASYFLFDGERISSISSKQDVTQAVKGLVDLNTFENAIEHLKRTQKILQNSLDLAGDRRAEAAKRAKESAEAELKLVSEQLQNIGKEIEYYEDEYEKAQQDLRDNENTASMQKKKEALIAVIDGLKRDYEIATKKYKQFFNRNPFTFFGKEVICRALHVVNDYREAENVHSYDGIYDETIYQIIKAGICICGTEIKEGEEAHSKLLKQLNYVPPNSIANDIGTFKGRAQNYLNDADIFAQNIEDQYALIRKYKRDIDLKEEELEQLSKLLLGEDKTKVLELAARSAWEKLKEKRKAKEDLIGREAVLKNTIEQNKRDFDRYVQSSNKNEKINLCLEYVEELIQTFKESYGTKEVLIKNKLQETVGTIFSKMYHGKRHIEIDSQYRIHYSDIKTDESGGLETVKNFAYVCGLVDLAKSKMNAEMIDGDGVEKEYPLIMDAPFSKADEQHVANISAILPDIAQQVVMIVMEKDWVHAKKQLETRIGSLYELVKLSETHTRLEGGIR